ncbi:hypothetical protein DLAC_05843 [Tieghemostelium lacteum]|uniref:Uncharacterized protein n=1 Tax=Tieghemostelium lacteum TaxID=361077 RepID=A0A151ZH64_TIELA|nr:hypothetical protein DLAC_05843 [Tieghemostelium lacteum]|eukprot:KYQ93204.1 hypothetical protein DLAC_05843 [Tieghemostelium lacteum]
MNITSKKSVITILLIGLVCLLVIRGQPTTLYSLSGVSQNEFVTVDLGSGSATSPKNCYLFNVFLLGMLSAQSEGVTYITMGYETIGQYQYNVDTNKYVSTVNISAPTQLEMLPQPYGYDPVNNRAFGVGIPQNGFSSTVTVNVYDFGSEQSSSTSLGFSDYSWDTLPNGYYDQYSGNYYIFQQYYSGINLITFNTDTLQFNTTTFDGKLDTGYVLTNLQGQLFFLDMPSSGSDYVLYTVDIGSQSFKQVLSVTSEGYSEDSLFPWVTDNGNYLVLLSGSNDAVLFTTIDLTSYQILSTSQNTASLPSQVKYLSIF